MARIGAKYPCWCSNAASSTGIVLGKLNKADVTLNTASTSLPGDDARAEYWSEFTSGTISLDTTNLSDDDATAIYGHTAASGRITCKTTDTAPEGRFAYYRTGVVDNVKCYKFIGYPRVKAVIGNDSDTTKGDTITFTTDNVTFEVMADQTTGEYREFQTYATEAAAKTAVETFCNITTVSNNGTT